MLLQWDWSESGPTGEESLALLEMEEHLALLCIVELLARLDGDEHLALLGGEQPVLLPGEVGGEPLALLEVPLEPPVAPVGVATPAVVLGGGKDGVPGFFSLSQEQLGPE